MPLAVEDKQNDFYKLHGHIKSDLLEEVRAATSTKNIWQLSGITPGAMNAFATMLVTNRYLEAEAHLPSTFKKMVLILLRNRNRESKAVNPAKMLSGIAE